MGRRFALQFFFFFGVDPFFLSFVFAFPAYSCLWQSYDTYRFHRGFAALSNFIVNDLSAFYFDAIKDRLYAG